MNNFSQNFFLGGIFSLVFFREAATPPASPSVGQSPVWMDNALTIRLRESRVNIFGDGTPGVRVAGVSETEDSV